MSTSDPRLKRLIRFLLVGGVATLLYIAIYTWVATTYPALSPTVIAIAAYVVCMIYSYLAHKIITFRSDAAHRIAVPKFIVSTALAITLTVAMTRFGHDIMGWSPLLTSVVTSVIVPVLNYVMLSFFVFAEPAKRAEI